MDQDELELTQEQLTKIAEYATGVIEGRQADPKKLAAALLTVAVCMHRLQAGDPPPSGPEVDQWYDKEIGQNMRVARMKVKPRRGQYEEPRHPGMKRGWTHGICRSAGRGPPKLENAAILFPHPWR